ncbi:hypothetical protein [Formosa sp. L2A11]|uniref:hypothetical protein n=1 Tax=Formosa sp. L2A11 TaxID=2686363 RepID=UPI00131DEB66|nr:hypothetical protein [Formosa sp. L2A11]
MSNEIQLKKQIPLMTNDSLKAKLESTCNIILEKIDTAVKRSKTDLGIDLSNTNYTKGFIKKYSKSEDSENIEFQNELLFMKFEKELSNFQNDYPSVIKSKALEMFSTDEDREKAKSIINLYASINHNIKQLRIDGLDLDTFILGNEFIWNTKIDTKIRKATTTYCKSQKQVDLLGVAEKISEIILHAQKIGLLANDRLGVNGSNLVDIDTGEIRYNVIGSIE